MVQTLICGARNVNARDWSRPFRVPLRHANHEIENDSVFFYTKSFKSTLENQTIYKDDIGEATGVIIIPIDNFLRIHQSKKLRSIIKL